MWYQPSENRTFTLHTEIRAAFPNTSFPQDLTDAMLADFAVYPLLPSQPPAYTESTHKPVPVTPIQINGEWAQQWSIVAVSAGEQQAFALNRLSEITAAVQSRLDNWAKERMYDGILSLCTYATSSIPRFSSEGQRGVDNRDATWAGCYTIMAAVQQGQRSLPTVADVMSELPVLEWP